MKKLVSFAISAYLVMGLPMSKIRAQSPCQLVTTKTPNSSVCAGSQVTLGVTVSGANTGNGSDGTITVNSTVYVDATKAAVSGVIGVVGSNSISVTSASGFAVGNEVLVITMQDATAGAGNKVGQFEFKTISSISANTLIFTQNMVNTYTASATLKHQVIRVPNYTNVIVANGGIITCSPWNGAVGGVVCFKASGAVTVNAGGSINADAKGYRGVAQKSALWRNADGGQGEGIFGTGIASGSNGGSSGNNSGSWLNANGNGGGGGTGTGDSGGGGGGGYGAIGTTGVNWGHTPGTGGLAVGNSSVSLLIMGGAGGEGGADEDGAFSGAGGNGGGILYVASNTLTVNGVVSSNGGVGNGASNGAPGGGCGTTAGGGGAGGSVILTINSFSGSGSNITTNGGSGGLSTGGCNSGIATGGAGSIGRIRIDMSGTLPVTTPAAFQGTNTIANGVTYSWSNGANTSNTIVTPTISSNYTVTIATTSGCTGASSVIAVTVNALPIITVASGSICVGQSFTLNPTGAVSYAYSSGSAVISPVSTTNYTVTGTSALGCTNTAVSNVLVNNTPTITVNSGAICSGQSFTISANGASTYSYQGGSNIVSPNSATNYTVTGVSAAGCVGNVVTSAITVNALPVVSITGTNALCAGDQISLTANGASTYTWDSGSNLSSITITPSTTTTYSLSGTSAAGCVGNIAVNTVTVNALPVVTISGTNSICMGNTASLVASGANTYSWNNGSTIDNISVSPANNTNYIVLGTDAFGCVGYSTQSLTVNALPLVSFSGNLTICSGESTSLTANGASTYTWSTNANTASISVSPIVNTSYSVSGTDVLGCVGNSTFIGITVNALPTVAITGTNALCSGDQVILSANGANTYTWDSGSNLSSITITPTITTTYSLTGTSVDGCVGNTAVVNVTVSSLPAIAISGANSICAGDAVYLSASGATSYSWDNGATSANITVVPSSNTTYTVNGLSAFGCVGFAIKSVTVNTLPIVSINGNNTICIGASTSLTANGASTYTWSTNANTTSISVSPIATTSYSVLGTNTLGCVGSSSLTTVTVNALPVVSITGNNTLCVGDQVNLNANGASTYTWSTGANLSSIAITPTATTTYSLNGTSALGCDGNTAVLTVTVNALPVVAISGTNAICAGASAALLASGANTYSWNTGAVISNINVSPIVNTTYTATGVSNLGCVGYAVKTISVNALPILSINGTNTICVGATASLTANGATTYTWSTNANTSTISVSPIVTTSYSVSGTNGLGCIGNSALATITVSSLPLVSITGTSSSCAGSQVNLGANGAVTYTWNTGSNLAAIAVNPTLTTSYTLTGASAVGCLNTAVKTLTVNALPIVVISGGSGICTGQNASLTVSGATTYSWNTGSTSNSIVTTPLTNTTYSVTGLNTFGCANTATQLVTVQLSLSVSITGPTSICEGQIANLSGLGGVTYTWNTGATSSTIAPTLTATSTFSVIGASGTCSNTAVKTISVNPNPTVTVSGIMAICAGDSTMLTALGANTYSWSNGTTTNTAIVSPSASSVYSVEGFYSTGCSHLVTNTVTVYVLPLISITGSSVLCSGDSISLTANGANSYVWNSTATATTIVVSPTVNTIYSVIGTDVNGCVGISAPDSIIVNPIPNMSIVASTSAICAGDSVSFKASGAIFYSWNTGSTDSLLAVTPTSNLAYTVTGTNGYACSATAVTSLIVNSLPTIVINGTSAICKGEEIILTASGANTYTWNAGLTTNTLLVMPTNTTTYTTTGTSSDGCVGTASLQVNVSECTAIKNAVANQGQVKMYPNPHSGVFTIELLNSNDVEITISNVLGQVILTQKAELFNSINLNDFDNGIYFINVLKNNTSIYRANSIKE